jgi:hypothetical protein
MLFQKLPSELINNVGLFKDAAIPIVLNMCMHAWAGVLGLFIFKFKDFV